MAEEEEAPVDVSESHDDDVAPAQGGAQEEAAKEAVEEDAPAAEKAAEEAAAEEEQPQEEQEQVQQEQEQEEAEYTGPLPEGWKELLDPGTGKTFYINMVERMTQWTRPRPAAPLTTEPPPPLPADAREDPAAVAASGEKAAAA